MARRLPVVLQGQRTDCGLAALAMVAQYHGREIGLEAMRSEFRHLDRGPSLQSILAIAAALGFSARPLRAGVDELGKLALPAILHWQFDHFVVLERVGKRHVAIVDPAVGRRSVERRELSESFTGVAVELQPLAGVSSAASEAVPTLRSLFGSAPGMRRHLVVMLLLMLATQVLTLAPPVATQLLIDEVVTGQQLRWLTGVLAGVGFFLAAGILLDVLRRRLALFAGARLAIQATASIVAHLLHLPSGIVAARTTGDLIARIDSMQPIRQALIETAPNALVQVLVLLTTLLAMLFYSPLLTLLSVFAIAATSLLYALTLPAVQRRNMQAIVHAARAGNSLIESLRGFETIDALGLRASRTASWHNRFVRAVDAQAARARVSITASAFQGAIAAIDQLAFLGIGVLSIGKQQMTLGVLFALFALRGRLNAAVASLVAIALEFYLLRAHVVRVSELLRERRSDAAIESAVRQRLLGSISAEDLCFAHTPQKPLLRNFSCRIEAGEHVVICGPSGAGKTTLLKVLSGVLLPDSGQLRFDGIERELWDPDTMRGQFGVVLQTDLLLDGSIADNISGFDVSPDLGRVRQAAELACIWDELMRLPLHVHTPVDSMSSNLSGGQLQRLLLARALYREPRILFLDEATAHLDRHTERRVLDNLARLDITIVSIAHGSQVLQRGERLIELSRIA